MRDSVRPLMTLLGKLCRIDSLPLKAALVLAILAAISCGPSRPSTAFHCPIRLGFVRAYSGPGALFGQSLDKGVQMGFDEINAAGGVRGCKVDLISYDTQSMPSNAASLTRRLIISDRVPLIIISSPSPEVIAAGSIAESMHVPLYAPSAASAKITSLGFKWVWAQSLIDTAGAKAIADYVVRKLNWKQIGVIYENTDYAKPSAQETLIPALKRLGAEVVANEAFNVGDVDLSAQLLRAKDAGAQGLIYWGNDKQGAVLTKQNQLLGIRLPIAGNTSLVYPAYLDLLPPNIQAETRLFAVGQFLWTSQVPAQAKWVKHFEARYHVDPDLTAREGYDATYLLKKVIESAPNLSPAVLNNGIRNIQYDGIGGSISFDSTGRAHRPQMIVELTPKSGPGFQVVENIPAQAY
jgi:branched-chain amino acid transport system substrate-binding protein